MRVLHIIGIVLAFLLKAAIKLVIGVLWVTLECLKIFLMMFGLVFRIFTAFVDGVTV